MDLLAEVNRIEFSHLRAVRAVPDTAESALLACNALQRGIITELEIDGRLWQNGDAHEVREEDDEGGVHDLLTECLFSHLEQVHPGRSPKHDILTSLTLKDIDATLCKHTWFTYLDLCHLKHLRLEHCKGADTFLMRLTSGAATLGLHVFTLIHDLGTHSDRTIHAVEDLLSSPAIQVEKAGVVFTQCTPASERFLDLRSQQKPQTAAPRRCKQS